jgi:hypothetical protein
MKPKKPRKSHSRCGFFLYLHDGISVAKFEPQEGNQMKDDPHLPERSDAQDEEFPCRSCGEKFNSLAEAEQHEKDCRNRKISGA